MEGYRIVTSDAYIVRMEGPERLCLPKQKPLENGARAGDSPVREWGHTSMVMNPQYRGSRESLREIATTMWQG